MNFVIKYSLNKLVKLRQRLIFFIIPILKTIYTTHNYTFSLGNLFFFLSLFFCCSLWSLFFGLLKPTMVFFYYYFIPKKLKLKSFMKNIFFIKKNSLNVFLFNLKKKQLIGFPGISFNLICLRRIIN